MTNNLKGAGRRGFFGFIITLSLFFFTYIPSSVTIGFHRSPTRTVYVKEGDSRRESLYVLSMISRSYNYYILAPTLTHSLLITLTNGYRLRLMFLYTVLVKFEAWFTTRITICLIESPIPVPLLLSDYPMLSVSHLLRFYTDLSQF